MNPDFKKPKGSWLFGKYVRAYAGSANPGLWPDLWKRASDVERARILQVWKHEKLGIFADPKGTPNAELLQQIGTEDAAPAVNPIEDGVSAGRLTWTDESPMTDPRTIIIVPTD